MTILFNILKEIVEPIVLDKIVDKLKKIAKYFGARDDVVSSVEMSVNIALKGIDEIIADTMATYASKAMDKLIDYPEESTIVSSIAGHIAGVGGALLSGGGITGTITGTCLAVATESFVRKSQYYSYMQYLTRLDEEAQKQSEKDLEEYGLCVPGFF